MRRSLIVASLLALPSLALAQRGVQSDPDAKTNLSDMTKSTAHGPTLRVRDVEDGSPLKLLLDKHKDLKLTDAQVQAFKDSESKLSEKNAPSLRAVDSLLHVMKNGATGSADDQREARIAQATLRDVLATIRANYDAAAKDAVATLDASQQQRANDFVAKQREDTEKNWRDRMSPGR